MDEERGTRLLHDLELCGGLKAAMKIEEIAGTSGSVGGRARYWLETQRIVAGDPAILKKLSEEWKATRRREPLNRLYNWICTQPVGAPLAPILELLGEPTSYREYDYRWDTDEEHPSQLVVHVDLNGALGGHKLK